MSTIVMLAETPYIISNNTNSTPKKPWDLNIQYPRASNNEPIKELSNTSFYTFQFLLLQHCVLNALPCWILLEIMMSIKLLTHLQDQTLLPPPRGL